MTTSPLTENAQAVEPSSKGRGVLYGVKELARRGWKYYRFFLWSRYLDHRFQSLSAEQIQRGQLAKLRRIVRHAQQNVPFYRDLYGALPFDAGDIKSFDDFRRLPVVTKEDLRRNFPDRIVYGIGRAAPADFGRSSGTTGESVQFVRQASWKKNHYYGLLMLHRWRMSPRTGELQTPQCTTTTCSIDDRRATLEDKIRGMLIRTRLNSYIYLPTSADIFTEEPEFFAKLEELLTHYKAEFLYGASNYVGQFARHLLSQKRTLPMKGVVCSSELLLASVEAEIAQAFACPVYNHYACSEIPGVADECREGRWHVRSDTTYVELTCEGRPAVKGELGGLLVTDLDNYRMPLIRYDVGDLGVESPEACPCGRHNMALLGVEGRRGDAWRNAQGQLVSAAAISRAAHRAGIAGRYQLVQASASRATLTWMDAPADTAPVAQALSAELEKLLGAATRVEIRRARSIAPERSNKYRLIFSQLAAGAAG
jgi:phenylacetate-CoA ligase